MTRHYVAYLVREHGCKLVVVGERQERRRDIDVAARRGIGVDLFVTNNVEAIDKIRAAAGAGYANAYAVDAFLSFRHNLYFLTYLYIQPVAERDFVALVQ